MQNVHVITWASATRDKLQYFHQTFTTKEKHTTTERTVPTEATLQLKTGLETTSKASLLVRQGFEQGEVTSVKTS